MIQDNILTLSFVNQRIIHIKKNKKKHIDLQSQVICLPKQSYKKKPHILEDNTSGVQVVVLNKWIMKPQIWKIIKFKIIKTMQFTSKSISSQLLLELLSMITFEHLILVFYIWVLNTTIEVTMEKKVQFKQKCAIILRRLTKTIMIVGY